MRERVSRFMSGERAWGWHGLTDDYERMKAGKSGPKESFWT